MMIFSTTFLVILRDSKKRPQPGAGWGRSSQYVTCRTAGNGTANTILGNANCSSAPGRFFCEPARIANGALSRARPNPQNDGDVQSRAHLTLEFTFVHSSRNEIPTCA